MIAAALLGTGLIAYSVFMPLLLSKAAERNFTRRARRRGPGGGS